MRVRARPVALLFATLAVAAALAGCASGPRLQVGAGSIETGAWSAWAFRGVGDLGACLEIVAPGRGAERLCNLEGGNAGSWETDAPPGESGFVTAISGNARAATAVLTLGDGTLVQGAAGTAPQVSDLRVFVLAAPPGVARVKVELLDLAGAVLETLPLNQG